MVTDIYMPVLPAILPLLIVNNGYSYLAAGLLVTAYNVTSSFTQPVVGWMSDTKGFSVSISISLLVSAVFVSLMGIAQDYYYLIMIFAIIAALGHACFHPSALSLVNRLCQPENRGRITSFFVVGGNFGYAIVRSGGVLSSGSDFPDFFSSSSRLSSWYLPSVPSPGGDYGGTCIPSPTKSKN